MAANPSESAAREATTLYESFHGQPSKYIDDYREPSPPPATLTQLGELAELRVDSAAGWKWRSIDFTKGNGMVPMEGVQVASNPQGTQIYFIGGRQKVSALAVFAADKSKELLDLGDCRYIAYRTRKAQADGKNATYEHYFGEETNVYPRLMYDRRGKNPRLYLVGGEYRVEARGIVN